MTKIVDKSAAIAKLGLPAGLLWAVANYVSTVQSGGAFDVQGIVTHLVVPVLAGFGVSSFAGPASSIATAFGGRRSDTMPVLESLKTLIEQFNEKGIPTSLKIEASWGDETYHLDWSKRDRPEKTDRKAVSP